MKYTFFLQFFLFSNILSILPSQNNRTLAVFKFKTFYPLTESDIENSNFAYYDFLFKNHLSNIYLEIELGEEDKNEKKERKTLNSFLLMDESLISFNNSNFINYNNENNKKICNYSPLLSKTFDGKYKTKDNDSLEKVINGPSKEMFKIYTDLSFAKYKNIKLDIPNDFNFNNFTYLCGNIGLKLSYISYYSYYGFLHQIKRNLKIPPIWSLKFSNEHPDEGLFVLGEKPHDYLENLYKEDDYYNVLAKNSFGGVEWKFSVDRILVNNNFYETDEEEIEISTEIEGIEINRKFEKYLEEIYFNKFYQNKICKSALYKGQYGIIFCNATLFGKKEINKFPKINFYKYKINQNFTFIGEELFYFKNNQYFFKMIENTKNRNIFKFGRLFLRKYQTVFEPENKYISFYVSSSKDESLFKEKKTSIYMTFYLIIIVFFIFVSGLLLGRKMYKTRKKFAYELKDDNYTYTEHNQKNLIFIEMK